MKINANNIRNGSKIYSNIILIIIGLAFGLFGFLMFGLNGSKQFEGQEPIQAEIVKITSEWVGDDLSHDVYVTFEYEGKTIENVQTNMYTSSYKEHDMISGWYNEDKNIFVVDSSGVSLVKIIVFGIAGLLVIGGLVSTIKTIRNKNLMNKQDEEYAANADKIDLNEEAKGEFKQYQVVVTPTKMKGNINIVNESGNVDYKAEYIKIGLFGNDVEFTNCVTNKKTMHRVGNVVRTTTNTGMVHTTESTFRLDKVDAITSIHRQGIRIESEILGNNILPEYTIKYQGKFYGKLKLNVVPSANGTQRISLDTIQRSYSNPVLYSLEAREEDLDIVFLTIFVILTSGQMMFD